MSETGSFAIPTLNLSLVNHAAPKLGRQFRGRASFGASANANCV